MREIDRYLESYVTKDLDRKMVFLGGPRQVGKTTLAETILKKHFPSGIILNWDDDQDRALILNREFPKESTLIVFDEIHKNRRWRNYLKGIFDKRRKQIRILVTGSARLDLYRFGGDSLQGRYYFHRLHPLTVAELGITSQPDLEALMRFSGFPEPFFSQDDVERKRWVNTYRARMLREDLRDLEQVIELSSIELLAQRLPLLVGSPLSINALREDLQVAHATVQKWLAILERLYFIYLVPPFGPPKIKAVRKQAKCYHLDWALVPDDGARFENFLAGHLRKWCDYQEDCFGRILELRYYRDIEGREVDFVVLEDNNPILLLECKSSFKSKARGLIYLKSRFPKARAVQVSRSPANAVIDDDGIERVGALQLLAELI